MNAVCCLLLALQIAPIPQEHSIVHRESAHADWMSPLRLPEDRAEQVSPSPFTAPSGQGVGHDLMRAAAALLLQRRKVHGYYGPAYRGPVPYRRAITETQ